MEFTGVDLSRFLKHEFRGADEIFAEKFWVNSYQEGRKESTNSVWTLADQKPSDPKTRYYPAYSKEVFSEKILPNLFTPSNT